MALSQLETKTVDGIEYIDYRPSLYYNKYRYRARFYCKGVTLAYFNRTRSDIEKKIKQYYKKFEKANPDHIMDFYTWKENTKKDKTATVRIEGNTASVFSNDLAVLKTLETIGCKVDYTEVDCNVELGVKYFVNEPKFKYRIYLRSKKVSDDTKAKLRNFINRYKDSSTKIIPSNAFRIWLLEDDDKPGNIVKTWFYNYKQSHLSTNFFINFDDESVLTLFGIMFPGLIAKNYKLEKRPDS